MTKKASRFYVRSPDGRYIFGLDYEAAAAAAALEYGAAAALVDTLAQAYHPMLQIVRVEAGEKRLVLEPVGGWDTGRRSVDRDLIEAVKKGRPEIVHAFLAKGASADARDERGGAALHWAAARGNAEVVALLLEHGADAAAQDSGGATPLAVAERRNAVDVVDLLRRGSR